MGGAGLGAAGGGIPTGGSLASGVVGAGKERGVLPEPLRGAWGCRAGVLCGDGGRRSRWRADAMGLKGRGGECLLSPVAAGRLLTSLKLGTGRNRLVF